ncbi:hypothetical protein BC628DRAFT_1414506 [Trametes gibbosa]|nr:hypothetical protein BC628DRAFT_1414506 [Trametes gibbosa]
MSLPSTSATISFAPLPAISSLNNTFGAILLGTCIGLILYGLTGHQTYRYFRLYPNDALVLKVLVAILMSLRLLPVVTGTLMFVCHSFYVRRVYLVGGLYRPLVVLVILLMFGELGFVTALTTQASIQPVFATWGHLTRLVSGGFGCALGADLVLASALIYILQRSRTGFKSTDSMIDILIVYTINTGLLTGFFSVLSLIFAIVEPNNFIYIALNMVLTRSYANSVLAV